MLLGLVTPTEERAYRRQRYATSAAETAVRRGPGSGRFHPAGPAADHLRVIAEAGGIPRNASRRSLTGRPGRRANRRVRGYRSALPQRLGLPPRSLAIPG